MDELNPAVEQAILRSFLKLDIQTPDFEEKVNNLIDQILKMNFKDIIRRLKKTGKEVTDGEIHHLEYACNKTIQAIRIKINKMLDEHIKEAPDETLFRGIIINRSLSNYDKDNIGEILMSIDKSMGMKYLYYWSRKLEGAIDTKKKFLNELKEIEEEMNREKDSKNLEELREKKEMINECVNMADRGIQAITNIQKF